MQHAAWVAAVAVPFSKSDVVIAQSAKVKLPVAIQRLSDTALLVSGPDGNVLVVDSSEGLILVDGGHADWYDSLHGAIAQQFPGRPYRALCNTHWHREQTGSNLPLGKKRVQIISHENTMLWESTEISQRWSGLKGLKPIWLCCR